MNGCWLLPTRNRLTKLGRVLGAIREVGISTGGLILVNKPELTANKAEYDKLDLPKDWRVEGVDADSLHEAVRAAWRLYKDLDWVGILSDDLIPASAGWDTEVVKHLNGWNFVSGDDSWQANPDPNRSRCHGATAWSGELIRTLGYLTPKGFSHMYVDDLWEDLGRTTGCWQINMQSKCMHQHVLRGAAMDETAARNNAFMAPDQARFQQWKTYERDGDIAKIKALQESKGLKTLGVDMNGVKLMVATPCIDDRWVGDYVIGLLGTIQLMQSNGVHVEWCRELHNADIALARSKVIGSFLASSCTHCLWIDSDMGWDPKHILRLFAAKKDFAAVAGPKKFEPVKFAANYTDDYGVGKPLVFDPDSGTFEMGEIGFAFTLITRVCAQRMIDAYPELSAESITGQMQNFLFLPFIEELPKKEGGTRRVYRSEDFAFCRRWQRIGGKVYCCADIPLKHIGDKKYEGAMMDAWKEEDKHKRERLAQQQGVPEDGQFVIQSVKAAE